jgi:hypothetical protein
MPSPAAAVWILAGAAFLAGLIILRTSGRFAKDARVGLATFCIFGLVAGLLGIANLVAIHRSRRISATGVIVSLSQYHGKHSHSNFEVRSEDGSLTSVTSDYTGDHLTEGDAVSVQLLSYESTLLHLTVLNGPFEGWTLDEGDGTTGSELTIGYGFFAATVAWVRRQYFLKERREIVDNS